jgi:predicted transcriptional regulator
MVLTAATLKTVKDRAIWKLPTLLKRESVTPYRLHQRLADILGTSRTTVYRWSNELPDTLDVALLMATIHVLREETGKNITLSDLLEYKEEA